MKDDEFHSPDEKSCEEDLRQIKEFEEELRKNGIEDPMSQDYRGLLFELVHDFQELWLKIVKFLQKEVKQ